MKKRVLAIMLACLMLVSLLPMGAVAANVQICPEVHDKTNCEYTLVRVQAPICGSTAKEDYGYTLYSCNLCGTLFADDFVQGNEKEEHTYNTVLDKDGHCAVNTCTKCGTEVIGCPVEAWDDATCTSPKTCQICGNTEGENAHVWGKNPIKILSEPNEKTFESGWALYQCEECEATEKFEILAHVCKDYLTMPKAATPGTCTEAGMKSHFECPICERLYVADHWDDVNGGWVYKEVTKEELTTEPAGHKAPDGTLPVVNPTCTTTGLLKYTCTACGKPVEEVMPVEHAWEIIYESKATCTTYGYKIEACKLCTVDNQFTVTNPSKHSDRPVDAVLFPATCTTNEYYVWACTNENCSDRDKIATEEVPGTLLGHEFAVGKFEANCQSYGLVYTYCTRTDEDGVPCCTGTPVNEIVTSIKVTNQQGQQEDLSLSFALETPVVVLTYNVTAKDSSKHPIPVDASTGLEIVTRIPATCTTPGVEKYWCIYCNNVPVTNILPALGHKKGQEINDYPTCAGAEGGKGYVCLTCGQNVYTEKVTYTFKPIYESLAEAMAVHTLVDLQQYIQGSCDKVGYYSAKCGNEKCGQSFLIKDENTGKHNMPLNLPAKPVDVYVTIPAMGSVAVNVDVANYDIYIYDSWNEEWGMNSGMIYEVEGEENVLANYSYFADAVVRLSIKADVLATMQFAAADATCTSNGWTAQYQCQNANCSIGWIVSESYIPAEETEDGKAVHPELAALNHPTKVVNVTAVAATCTTAGRTEGWSCSTCNTEVKSVVVPATGHDWNWVNSVSVPDEYSAELYVCGNCDLYTVQEYVSICEHNWVVDLPNCIAATCYLNEKGNYGVDAFICTVCETSYMVELEPADHVNKDGVVINKCSFNTDSEVDNVCVNCPAASNKIEFVGKDAHSLVKVAYYAATCTARAYEVYDCEYCSFKVVQEIGDEPNGHEYELHVITDKDGKVTSAVNKCANCDAVERVEGAIDYVIFSFGITNAADEDAYITDGSLIKVAVKVSGKNVGVWGLRMDIAYSDNLTYVSAEGASADWMALANNNAAEDGNYVSLFAQVNGTEDFVVEDEATVAYLYFRVNKAIRHDNDERLKYVDEKDGKTKYNSELVEISIKELNDVRNADGDKLPYASASASAKTVEFLDLDDDNVVSVNDVLGAYKLMTSGEYDSRVDINKNGIIDVEDMNALYLYFIGAQDYVKTVAVGTKK